MDKNRKQEKNNLKAIISWTKKWNMKYIYKQNQNKGQLVYEKIRTERNKGL